MEFALERDPAKTGYDHALAASVLLLTGIGLVTLYSASYSFAERHFHDRLFFISRQVLFAALGIAAFAVVSRMRLSFFRKIIMPLVLLAIILCLFTFVPGIGVIKNGASRWIKIGSYTYQPSELVKLVLPLYLAHIFDKKKEQIDHIVGGVLPPFLVTALFFVLIYCQNNFSTAFFIAINSLVIFFLSGVKLRYFFSAALILFPLSFLLIFTKQHRLIRFISFIWPESDPLGSAYQVSSAVDTIASGGFWGKGIGQGTRKLASVPEIHSDFVFAGFCEEAGFLGVMLFTLLFGFFAWRAYTIALRREDTFGRLLACGLATMIVSQALLNIAVISGFLPATGIPLPFFSAGGSSLATTLVICGFIVNVSREEKVYV